MSGETRTPLMRSVFFIPGSTERLLAKAPAIRADVVAFDLEDAVPPAEKPRARELVRGHLRAVGRGTRAFCRVNGWETGLTDADLEGVVGPGLAGICLPKCEGPEDVRALDASLERLERSRGLALGAVEIQAFVESARGLVRAYDAATSCRRVRSLAFGSLDYARDMGLGPEGRSAGLAHARAGLAVAARAAGCLPIDHVYPDFHDPEGFECSTREGRGLGYAGRLLFHPSQIEPCHRAFAPSDDEVAWAGRVVAAFEAEALPRGLAAISFEGTMADLATYEEARSVLAAAAATRQAEREAGLS
jgi:citrate lyase subunit beta/citryl-CoA lyase